MSTASQVAVAAFATVATKHMNLRHAAGRISDVLGSVVDLALAMGDLDVAADDTIAAIDSLRERIAGLGPDLVLDRVESLAELAIRLRTRAIGLQLEALESAFANIDEIAASEFLGVRFGSIGALVACVRARLVQINQLWIQYRRAESADPIPGLIDDPAEEERQLYYRSTLLVARREMLTIGNDPDVAHFLRRGIASQGWPEVQTACANLCLLIAVPILMPAEVALASVDTTPAPRPRLPATAACTPVNLADYAAPVLEPRPEL
jgi:hypothetical protein